MFLAYVCTVGLREKGDLGERKQDDQLLLIRPRVPHPSRTIGKGWISCMLTPHVFVKTNSVRGETTP